MYSILLVDDEEEVRNKIRDFVPWNDYGFEISNEASNGLEALDIINEKIPDVIITDIKMPYLDGIELIKRIRNSYSSTVEIIILSGYDEFTYAQEAVKLKVAEYVLKPIGIEKTKELLKRTKERLDKNRERLKNSNLKYLDHAVEVYKKELLSSLVLKKDNTIDYLNVLSNLGINLSSSLYVVSVIEPYSSNMSINSLLSLSNEVWDLLKDKPIFFPLGSELILIFKASSDESENDFTLRLYNNLKLFEEGSHQYYKEYVNIGIGKVIKSINDLPLSYNEALEALSFTDYLKEQHIISLKDIKNVENEGQQKDIGSLKSDLIFSLKFGNNEVIENCIKAFFKQVSDYEKIQTILLYILGIFSEICQSYSISFLSFYKQDIFQSISTIRSLSSAEKLAIDIGIKLNKEIKGTRENSRVKFVERAKEIILKRFTDPLFSLEDLCEEVKVSPPYFSTTFKKETGYSFVQYLTNARLEKAKELLKNSDDKNYVIAEKSGFSDPNYFAFTFKKNIGSSPSQYRAKLRNEVKA